MTARCLAAGPRPLGDLASLAAISAIAVLASAAATAEDAKPAPPADDPNQGSGADVKIRSRDTGLPPGIGNFDVAIGPGGDAHLAFVREKNLYYTHSAAHGGGKWSSGLQLNAEGKGVAGGWQAGPSLALSKTGRLAAVWHGTTAGASRPGVWCAVSDDEGKAWRAAVRIGTGVFPAAAWGGDGRLDVVWLDDPESERVATEGAALFRCRSDAGGKAFQEPDEVRFAAGSFCATCRPAVQACATGKTLVAARAEIREVRDVYFLSFEGKSAFPSSTLVSSDMWKIRGGVRSGPSLAVSPDGATVGVAWMYKRGVYWSFSRRGGDRFPSRASPLPLRQEGGAIEDLPSLAIDAAGRRLMAYHCGQHVAVAMDGADGKPLARGSLDEPGMLPRVVAAPDGHFRVFWLSRKEGLFAAEIP